jgi:hypothetical protein
LTTHVDKPEPPASGEPLLSCALCRSQIPKSEALSDEASDYVYYFCGADCYAKWTAGARPEKA